MKGFVVLQAHNTRGGEVQNKIQLIVESLRALNVITVVVCGAVCSVCVMVCGGDLAAF